MHFLHIIIYSSFIDSSLHNNALHRTAFSLRSKAAGELYRHGEAVPELGRLSAVPA
jgi:hypothetical protein